MADDDAMNGKGIMIWKGKNCAGGSLNDIVQACLGLGLRWVALKIGDGTDINYASFADMRQAVDAFRKANLAVWGWHYVYGGLLIEKNGAIHVGGATPVQEATFAVRQVKELALDGYIVDAEREFKVSQPAKRALAFMGALQGIGVPVALSSYRFPSLHPEFPWGTFLAFCDLHMPQVYWGPGKMASNLDQSLLELATLRRLPVAPIGRAYIGDGYPAPGPGGDELHAFLERAEDRHCPGASFWALDFLYLHAGGPERGRAIAGYKWREDSPPGVEQPPKVFGKIRVTASILNIRSGPTKNSVDMGDLQRGTEWYVFGMSPEIANLNGYQAVEWVMIGDGAWVCLGGGLAEWVARYGA